jgi:hypothetical protein
MKKRTPANGEQQHGALNAPYGWICHPGVPAEKRTPANGAQQLIRVREIGTGRGPAAGSLQGVPLKNVHLRMVRSRTVH